MKKETKDRLLLQTLRIILFILLCSLYFYVYKHGADIASFFLNHLPSSPSFNLTSMATSPQPPVSPPISHPYANMPLPAINTHPAGGPCIPHTYEGIPLENRAAYVAQLQWQAKLDTIMLRYVIPITLSVVYLWMRTGGGGGRDGTWGGEPGGGDPGGGADPGSNPADHF